MKTSKLTSRKTLLLSLFVAIGAFVGCQETYSIRANNQSNLRLTDLSISDGSNTFKFGVMGGNGVAGFMNAESKFGNPPPDFLDVTFIAGEEEVPRTERVEIPELSSKKQIDIIIDAKLKVSIKTEH